jgi:hypothetical protein
VQRSQIRKVKQQVGVKKEAKPKIQFAAATVTPLVRSRVHLCVAMIGIQSSVTFAFPSQNLGILTSVSDPNPDWIRQKLPTKLECWILSVEG